MPTKRPVFTSISLLVAGAMFLTSCATATEERRNDYVRAESSTKSAANLPFEMCPSDADTCFSWSADASQECIDNYPLLLTEENRFARGPFEVCVYELDFLGIEHLTPERFVGPVSEIANENAKRLQSLGWDRAQASPIQMLATPDVPQDILDATSKSLRAATDYLGNYGPLKFYTVGNDPEVVEPIIK
ncbi:MAG: hypothetical protein QMB74_07385, partial [Aquiluna sp.]